LPYEATVYPAAGEVRGETVPDPKILEPADAIVRVIIVLVRV
jgi:hypothetical protein